MSACQPCPPCAGKVGSDRKKSEVSWQGGSRPESFRILCPGHGSTGDRRALLVPCRCHRSAASPELCPIRECCRLCLLQLLSPRVLESPPWFPRLPLCPMGELPCPYLSVVAFNNFFFQPELIQHCLLIAPGAHPRPTRSALSVCSFVCRTAHRNISFPPLLIFPFTWNHHVSHVLSPFSFVAKRAHAPLTEGLGAHFLDSLAAVSAVRPWTGTGWIFHQ